MNTTINKYSNLAIILHWLMAVLIVGIIFLGWYMDDLPKGSLERSYFFGITLR